ncbi:helix-turn-helix domain-containing protein [Aurantimonas sp. E1-2-R+4]|uniref:helix-turn-helix transcriptional regulator n=1 Tax=Aurantimonas sp. E1-2-R+4 TaxID=3113714 RepID=UPI002F92C487
MLSTNDAAEFLGMSASWLNKTRMAGNGPIYLKVGGRVRYRQNDLTTWLDSTRRTAVYDHANDNAKIASRSVAA